MKPHASLLDCSCQVSLYGGVEEHKWIQMNQAGSARHNSWPLFPPNNRPITVNQLDIRLHLLSNCICDVVVKPIVLTVLPVGVPLATFSCQVHFPLTTWPRHLHQQELASCENNQNQALCVHHLHDVPKQKQNLGYDLSSWPLALETFFLTFTFWVQQDCKSQRFLFCFLT